MNDLLEPPARPDARRPVDRILNVARPLARRRSSKIFMWVAALSLVGFLAVGLIAPRLASWQAQKMTGRNFRFGFLVISPNGRVSISARGAQQLNEKFHLNVARARLDWWNVFLRRIRVGYVDLADARIDIEQTPGGDIVINGVNLASLTSAKDTPAAPAPEAEAGKAWGLGLGRFSLTNIELYFLSPELTSDVKINRLVVGAAESWKPERETPIEADLTVNGAPIHIRGTITPFSDAPRLKADVSILKFPLGSVPSLFSTSDIEELSGSLSVDGRLDSTFFKKDGLLRNSWNATIALGDVGAVLMRAPATEGGPKRKFRVNVDGSLAIKDMVLERRDIGAEQHEMAIEVDQLKNSSPLRLTLRDESFRRPPTFRFEPLDINLENVSTKHPDRPVSFEVKAALGTYDRIAVTGAATVLAKVLNGQVSTRIDELNLTPFTAYAERYTGSRIKTGVLNLDSKVTLADDQLEGVNKILLQKLDFQYINTEKEEEQTGKVGIPSNVLLSLLKDSKGNINLEVPLSGPARDPDIGFGPLMAKLSAKAFAIAAQKAATAFFPPLKTAQMVFSGVKFAMKWRFEPLVFQPATLTMTRETEEYLAAVGVKLQERPGVQLNVCGFGTRQDLAKGSAAKTPKKDSDAKPKPLTPAERDLLIQLASDRSASVKDFFVNRYSIDSSRLLICSPDVDEGDQTIPRVTLSL